MLIRIISLALLGLFVSLDLSAQRVTVAVEPIEHFDPYFEDLAGEVEDFVTTRLTENKALRVVERTGFSGITEEQERQKNEGFIDGETVDQGKLVGARLIVRFSYNEDAASLRMQVVDIAAGEILGSGTYSTEVGSSGKLPQTTRDEIADVLHRCFQPFSAPAAAPLQVVELLTKTAGPTRLLVYSDDARSIKAGDKLSVFVRSPKKIGGKTVDYAEVIGELIVEEIENKNFLNGKVTTGAEAIRQLLTDKKEVYAKSAE